MGREQLTPLGVGACARVVGEPWRASYRRRTGRMRLQKEPTGCPVCWEEGQSMFG